MPAARGVKRSASKASALTTSASAASASTASTASKSKKKRGVIQLEIPKAPTQRGRVYACGQGDVGQLGLGEDVIETTKFKQVTVLGDKIVAVSAGGMHTIALDSSGKVWTFGCNDEGALGRATTSDKDEGTPKKVSLPSKAVAVTAGDSHSAALLENGDVYAWGSFRDSHGSMGLVVQGREGKPCRDPVHVDVGEQAVALASGGDHLVILTTSGSVYTMGCGEQGQLGRLSQRSASRDARQGLSALLVPCKVSMKGGASRVWAGYHATFLLDSNQEKVFAFGLNNYGQLGITGEKRKTALYMPCECPLFKDAAWRAIAAGQHHSVALDEAGRARAIGRCEYGRLGLGEGVGDAENLEIIPKLQTKKCISISAGTSNSFAVTDSGEVFAWGMGSEGQLGTGNSSDAVEPTPAVCSLQNYRAVSIAAGGQHTVLLAIDPDGKREPSPEPEQETEEEKVEHATEEEEDEDKEDKPLRKRAKKEQEGEVTSTSSAQASEVGSDSKPQKLNGDENKDAVMEVDETDHTDDKEKQPEPTAEPEQKMETDEKKPEPAVTVTNQTTDEEKSQEDSQDSTKTQESEKSQDSESQDSKSQDSQDSRDVEMSDKTEVNGTEETPSVEAKTVDLQTNPLTTTA